MALRIDRELPVSDEAALESLYQDLLLFWEQGLLRHFRAENECLLARLVRHVSLDDELVRRTQKDHLKMEALTADMRDSPSPDRRREAMARFGEILRDHIRWEEEKLFEASQRLLKGDELKALGRELEQRLPPLCLPWLLNEPKESS